MKKILLCIATAVLLMTLMANPVLAAEPENTVSLPVSQTVKLEGEGAKAEDAAVQYVLTALDEKTEPEKPEPVTPGGGETPPKTGDTFPLGTYGAVALTSVILLVLLNGRRKKDEA